MPLPYGYLVNESAGRKRLVSVFPWNECYEDDSSSTESSVNDPRANRARVNLYSRRFPSNKPAPNDSAENQHIVDILPWPRSKANDLSWTGFSDSRSPWVVKCENGSRVVRSKVEGSPWKSSNVNEASWSVHNNYSGSRSRQLSEIRTASSENTGSGNGASGSSQGSSAHWSRENESIWSISSINGNEINVSRFSAIGRNDPRATRLGVKLPGLYESGRNESRSNGSQVNGSRVNGSQVNGSGLNESSRTESAANGSRGNESSREPPRPRRWKRRAPRCGGGGVELLGEDAPRMRGCARAAWRAGCGRRAGAIVGLLLALACGRWCAGGGGAGAGAGAGAGGRAAGAARGGGAAGGADARAGRGRPPRRLLGARRRARSRAAPAAARARRSPRGSASAGGAVAGVGAGGRGGGRGAGRAGAGAAAAPRRQGGPAPAGAARRAHGALRRRKRPGVAGQRHAGGRVPTRAARQRAPRRRRPRAAPLVRAAAAARATGTAASQRTQPRLTRSLPAAEPIYKPYLE